MAQPLPATLLSTALARLETRWGNAAVRLGTGAEPLTQGALALAARSEMAAQPGTAAQPAVLRPLPAASDVLASGLPELDALLGSGGLPRAAVATLQGAGSSGKTTLALHWLTRAQAQGAIAAYLDIGRSFDPLEAASRGVDLRWLLVLRPASPDEGFALAGSLLAGHAVELLVVDLPDRLPARHEHTLRRLVAHARRASARLIVLEPIGLAGRLHTGLAEAAGLRLELEQRGWLRLGRDIVGRRIAVNVAKNRFGPPGRRAEIEIRYLPEGELTAPIDHSAPDAARAPAA